MMLPSTKMTKKSQQHDDRNGQTARNAMVLQHPNRGRQHEAQDASERNRKQNFVREVQGRHDDHGNQHGIERRR